jgi:hypothetical protein
MVPMQVQLLAQFGNFGQLRASTFVGGGQMSVTRISEVLQPAWIRTASALAEASSILVAKLQFQWKRTVATSAQAADVLVALMTPAAVVVLVLGLWRLAADLGWTEVFPISTGFFSHWQVWMALAIALKFGGSALAAKMSPNRQV